MGSLPHEDAATDRAPACVASDELIARVAAGECAAAMRELYARYGSRLYGLGLRLLGDLRSRVTIAPARASRAAASTQQSGSRRSVSTRRVARVTAARGARADPCPAVTVRCAR